MLDAGHDLPFLPRGSQALNQTGELGAGPRTQFHDCHDGAQRIVRRTSQPDALDPETPVSPLWLGETPAGVPQLKALLAPYPSDEMICWPVSARVGNVKNNDPSLIEPVTPS